jgi:pimeloyl-ACP methyl ester carboxylesterase
MRELKSALTQIKNIPVLLIWGTRDRAVSLTSGQVLKKKLQNAEMIVIPGVGHLPFEETPGLFAETVNNFLRKQQRGELHFGPRLVRP